MRRGQGGPDGEASSPSACATFAERAATVVAGLRPGEVVTYGEVALEAGRPGAARAVGNMLAVNGDGLPWWRVVRSDGRLAPGKEAQQARRLLAEGVAVDADRLALRAHGRGARARAGPRGRYRDETR